MAALPVPQIVHRAIPASSITATEAVQAGAYSPSLTTFVLGGDEGHIVSSTDGGETWTARTSQFGTTGIYSIVWSVADSQFVAMGAAGKVSTSPTGATWTAQTAITGTPLVQSVCYSETEDKYVAVCYSGAILTSTDAAVTWQSQTSFTAQQLYSVVRSEADDLYVAFGLGGSGEGIVGTSNNGTTWTDQSGSWPNPPYYGGYKMAYSAALDQYIATTPHGLLTSSNGTTFTLMDKAKDPTRNTATSVYALEWSDHYDMWILALSPDSHLHSQVGRTLAYSADGLDWSYARGAPFVFSGQPEVIVCGGPYIVMGAFVGYIASGTAVTAPLIPAPDFTQRTNGFGGTDVIRGACYSRITSNEKYVVVGDNGKIYTSVAMGTWTAASTPSFGTTQINDVCYSEVDGRCVAVGNDGKIAYSSAPAGTWTQAATPSFGTTHINAVCKSHVLDLFVAVGDSGKIATSPDGNTWTQRTSNLGTTNINGVAMGEFAESGTSFPYTKGLFIAVADSGKMATSTNGTTWTDNSADSPFGATNNLNDVDFDEIRNVWMVVGQNLSGDPALATGHGFDDSGAGTTLYWTQRTVADFATNDEVYSVAYSHQEGRWIIAGTGGKCMTSTDDGVNWSTLTSGFTTDIHTVEYGVPGYWIMGGASGKLASGVPNWYYSFTTATWPWTANDYIQGFAYSPSLARWVMTASDWIGGAGKIAYSDDQGVTWTNVATTSFGTSRIGGVAWSAAESQFVAGGCTVEGSTGGGKIATSPTGTTWTQRTSSAATTDDNWRVTRVESNDKWYINTEDSLSVQGSCHTSTSGTSGWTEAHADGAAGHVRYATMRWSEKEQIHVAAGRAGAISTVSPDGATWTARTNAFTDDMFTLCRSEEHWSWIAGGRWSATEWLQRCIKYNGASWAKLPKPMNCIPRNGGYIWGSCYDSFSGDLLMALTSTIALHQVVLRSGDGGDTWQAIPGPAIALGESPFIESGGNGTMLIGGTGAVISMQKIIPPLEENANETLIGTSSGRRW